MRFGLLFLFLSLIACRETYPYPYTIHKSATATDGMVVTAHPIATEVGIAILKQGGNAADAAIAVQLALAVVYPRAGNIGGGGFLVYRDSLGEITSLDYREKASMAASRDMYIDTAGNVIPGLSQQGMRAAGIPGTIAGLVETHNHHGSLPWATLVEPAITLAKKGFRITALEASRLNDNRAAFVQFNAAPIPFVKNKPWKAGDRLIQPDLANTLERIAINGQAGFYEGPNAALLDSFSKTNNGIITKADLQSYKAIWREPFINHFRGYVLYSMGLPSSGGILLGHILDMIDLRINESLPNHNPHNVHLIVEAERRAYMMRATYLGDADHYPVVLDSLLAAKSTRNQFAEFDSLRATPSQSLYAGEVVLKKERFETCHISIVDKHGNAAAVTTTLNDNYGCKVWVPGGGYFLNNEMDDFSVKPGTPNIYGLIGGEANAIAPGKRMLSSMTPTIVEKDDKLWMVLGTPGGSTIITSVLQVFLNKAVYGMSIDDAVQSPRYHHQWLPDEIMYEHDAFDSLAINTLRALGHTLKIKDDIGLVEAIWVDEAGALHGAADRRGEDHASGW